MTRTRLTGLMLGALLVTSARADLTLRWNMNFKFTEGLPKQFTEAAQSQAAMTATSMTIQYRDGRAAMDQGPIRIVADYDKGLITMFHPESKRVATMAASKYPPQLRSMQNLPPEARKMFEQMKFEVQSERPGRFETIRGIRAEEYQIRMSMTMPMPAAGFEMKFIMSQWMPTAEEVERVPALRQCAALMARAKGSMDPSAMMQRSFGAFPGVGEKFKSAFEDLMKSVTSIGLRMRMTIVMPGLARMMEPLKQKGIELPAGFDGTLGHMTMELDRMDEEPVPESAFAIPEGYEKVPMEDLMKVMAEAKGKAN